MSQGWGAWGKRVVVVSCLVLALQTGHAQARPTASPAATRAILVENAQGLEARGRPDLAIQVWQQVLLSDPNNTVALAGLARDLRLTGSVDRSNQALDHLRRINPSNPEIARIQALSGTSTESDLLRRAGELAREGKVEDAMRIYRQLFGDHPPGGAIGMAYYQTLFGTLNGKQEALAGMRALAQDNPGDPRFAIALGIMLTYDARTRDEGMRILRARLNDPTAQAGLRQAIIWNGANPNTLPQLRAYLKAHPHDTEIARLIRENERKMAQTAYGIARTPAEVAAFAALNVHRTAEAEKRFDALLAQNSHNGRAMAGLGFLRMQQKNFGEAIRYLTLAEQTGFKAPVVRRALATSRMWRLIDEATAAFNANDLNLAAIDYRDALSIDPRRPEALNGLAGVLTRQEHYAAAAGVYEQLVRLQPDNADAWRGLFVSYAQGGDNQKALATISRFPPHVKAGLDMDPACLRALATVYQAQGRYEDAQQVLARALALPFPRNGSRLEEDTKLQYAGILMAAKHYDQAAALYGQILESDPNNLSAWMGMISAHHSLGQDAKALADVKRMPAATYDAALANTGFLSTLAAMYQSANQYAVAQEFLERAQKLETAAGNRPSVALMLQLAAINLLRNQPAQAFAIYRGVLAAYPGRPDAWKGLITALQASNRDTQAIKELALMPAPVRKNLESDIAFVQIEASLYAATGDTARALHCMDRVNAYYANRKELPPPDIAVQNAWLLYNAGSDRALYSALMQLGARGDLTLAQREQVQNIWANWSVRRAGVAMNNGNYRRAVEILDAASKAFPNNLTVRKAVAGGYAQVGRAKEALALFKTVPMQNATSGDFQGAIGAALAANDKTQAETWLRQALARYPRDPAILVLAARYEMARGDKKRAADYYRASLAAMPAPSPVDKLARVLVYPEEDLRTHPAVTAADLYRLLDPNNEPLPKTTKLPPLPAHGPDPNSGSAPVVLPPPKPAPQQPQNEPANSSGPMSESRPASTHSADPAVAAVSPAQVRTHGRRGRSIPQPAFSGGTEAGLLGSDGLGQTGNGQVQPQAQTASVLLVELSLNPPHSLASDAWKGLIFSLMAGNHYRQALQQLYKIPPSGTSGRDAESPKYIGQMHLPPSQEYVESANSASASGAVPPGKVQYTMAQDTPSPRQATTGAYSAPTQQTTPQAPQPAPAPAKPTPSTPTRRKTAKRPAARGPATQTPGNAPIVAPALPPEATPPAGASQPNAAPPQAHPSQAPPTAPGGGLTNQELEQQNLPPLTGPYVRSQRQPPPLNPREEAEMQLAAIESGYSGWLGGTARLNYRSGVLGYGHLAAFESPFEASAPLGSVARITVVAQPVLLDSGQADGTATISVVESTSSGSSLTAIPEPIGTLTDANLAPPAQQNAFGIGGELQLIFPHFALAGGYTPYGFLVSTFIARAMWNPGNGPLTFIVDRDSQKDSQLSYAGLRDPAGNTLGTEGRIWGGVINNQGEVQYTHSSGESGFYLMAGGQYLTGDNVESNTQINGTGGAYWRTLTLPEYGNLSVGANFFAMHYAHNENAFTHGMGGYFSPQGYILANVPFTWGGHYATKWHYNIMGAIGVQAFEQKLTPLWPLAADKALETSQNNPQLPALTQVSANYDLNSEAAYQVSPHWFAGGYLAANDTRNYSYASVGFFVRYLFRSQPSTATAPTGLFPSDGLRPFSVP